MGDITDIFAGRHWSRWRMAMWGTAAFLLLLPAVAMLFTSEVDWNAADFIVMGAILAAACGTCELGARASANGAYRLAVCIAVGTAFLLIWINLAVGIIGNEGNPANMMYFGVILLAIFGAIVARGRPDGMALAMVATAIALGVAGAVGTVWMYQASSPAPEILVLTGFFAVAWLMSAALFRKAARDPTNAGATR